MLLKKWLKLIGSCFFPIYENKSVKLLASYHTSLKY